MNFFGVKFFVTSFILKVRKSHKKSACLDAYLHVYTRKRDRGGTLCPPPALNRVKKAVLTLGLDILAMIILKLSFLMNISRLYSTFSKQGLP